MRVYQSNAHFHVVPERYVLREEVHPPEGIRDLGHTGPEDMSQVPKNVYAIDCDNFNTRYDWPKGHTYFIDDQDGNPGAVFEHIYKAIKQGRVLSPVEETRRTIILD